MFLIKFFKRLALCTIVWAGACSDSSTEDSIIYENNGEKRVVGYLPYYRFFNSNKIDYCKLTHLNLAFANPDNEGNLIVPESINDVVNDARSRNGDILIFISLAGGSLSVEQEINWSSFVDDNTKTSTLVDKIIDYVLLNDLDGVDVDLEWSHVTIGYSNFILTLNQALKKEDKLLTAALPNNTRFEHINDAALAAFDFINIMAYDGTGPWNANNPGQHSSYDFAENGIDFWNSSQNINSDRLTLGVPFYGYDFTNQEVVSFTYGQMIEESTEFADLDESTQRYYNGRSTIERKVELAVKRTGGIMIWELGQDSFDQYSLLNTIHNKFTVMKVKTTGMCGN
ncbi:glycosyl hydrolase family 18 protein [Maribacter sp. HTCC2170]|uniref:glycosyl hydrolase family 18 protein n=1 Tax=Maribacter sp. (strain HTCC2170 / KCCM 42371) TaxID=313603 RepID=UPI00006BD2AB|nr:glycosyl hydrolase family 18 protein [Maribacter sp. HTCC2170]EAR02086.1 Chitinase [Maribacter sp. HTCC2170]